MTNNTKIEVTRTYLKMTTADELNPAKMESDRLQIHQVVECPASFYRYLYTEVGRKYHWGDRLTWTDEEIRTHLNRANVSVWVLYSIGAPAGFFELKQHEDKSVEIAYFGILDEFLGRGFGKHLLTVAIERAWDLTENYIWLHTCTLDHPAAIPNYLNRGFRPFKQETYYI
ncbi:GNAT family N-acetyltransferase [Scytonema millei]|uniref:GNAT family N-acetyltransferase n=1 Tax=Scytonema millei VB511283 TaxID=1245923 RepID=A0A9X5E324_9CYAN|nr:GNAT family N-acetyltransferase [Scytonema millei]NHC33873.1 GNAT family N-acetyltransferase [Scytonema millei VB511283]